MKTRGHDFAEAMKRIVPRCDSPEVQYALAAAARHFGIYSRKTSLCDVARSLFGNYVSAHDASTSNSGIDMTSR
jgi:hypothetical protein